MAVFTWCKGLWKFICRIALALGFIIIAMVLGATLFPKPWDNVKETKLTKPHTLHWKFMGNISYLSDTGIKSILSNWGYEPSYNLFTVKKKLEKASNDPNVKGLLVELRTSFIGSTELYDLRQILSKFKKNNKTLTFWAPSYSNSTYYLASIADEIILPKSGEVFIEGKSFRPFYLKSLLTKLGINFESLRVGKYKSAVESFTNNESSNDSKKMYESLVGSSNKYFYSDIAKSRKVKGEKVKSWIKKTMFNATQAKEHGIINDIAYISDIKQKLKQETLFDFDNYISKDLDKKSDNNIGIGFISTVGQIMMSNEMSDSYLGNNPYSLHKQIKWALEDERVKAVVYYIDSPGGSLLASDLMWKDISLLSNKKPLIVAMGGVAASGGYYVSLPAKKIYANPLTLTGSIGIFALIPNIEKKKWGVSLETFSESPLKNIMNPTESLNRHEKNELQLQIKGGYDLFISRLKEGRKSKISSTENIAEGRVWTGIQAKNNGLIDVIGGVFDAVAEAKELAEIDAKTIAPIYMYSQTSSIKTCLLKANPLKCLKEGGVSSYINNYYYSYLEKELLSLKKLFSGSEHLFALSPVMMKD